MLATADELGYGDRDIAALPRCSTCSAHGTVPPRARTERPDERGDDDRAGPAAPRPAAQREAAPGDPARRAPSCCSSHGLGAVSMDAVAERAGVSKATIYRWWPTKETLALDALYNEWAPAERAHRDTGSLRGDLLALLRPWARRRGTGPTAA